MASHERDVDDITSNGIVLTDEIRHALELLHGGHDLLLTGKAGTGKSTLIRHFLDETEHPTLVAAPTGIAALNVGGYTIHRLFGFHPSHTVEHIRSSAYRPSRFATALSYLHTLVLDEASMIRADVFDMIAVALERFGPDPTQPFGGVQLVLVGDLFQLPPVVTEHEAAAFATVYDTPYFFSAKHFSRKHFPTVDLNHVFRQSDDPALTSILNSIREGSLVGHALERLNARTDPDFEPPDGEFWLTLTTTSRIAADRNRRCLERLPGDELAMEATTTGDVTDFEPPTARILSFKIGAQVMMLTNDPYDRWVNGSIGRVLDVTFGRRGDRDERGPVVVVEFTDGEVAEVALHTWDVTRPVSAGGTMRHEVVGTFTQYPFALSWAITIHKSQGQTLDRLVVDLSGGTFAAGQLYVALSRCRSLDGLVLTRPVHPRDLKTDRRITRFLRTLDTVSAPRRYCAIAALSVGDEGTRARPRPVELAVAFQDGTAVTTLINPQRDLAQARSAFGITVSDVLLAPTLLEAWTLLAPLLDGYTPVAVDVDRTLGELEFELRRLGSAAPLPLGVDVPGHRLTPGERARARSGSALTRARTALEALTRLSPEDNAAGSFDADLLDESEISYLVSRDADVPPPSSRVLPQLSAILEISARVGPALLGLQHATSTPTADVVSPVGGPADGAAVDPAPRVVAMTPGDHELLDGASALVAEQIRRAAERVPVTADVLTRLRHVGTVLGTDVTEGLEALPRADAAAVLTPGTRVCFTGSALDDAGVLLSRESIEALAIGTGLEPVDNVTKTRCDVLVVAEHGTQSIKARNARKWDKPILSVAEFLAWAHGPGSPQGRDLKA